MGLIKKIVFSAETKRAVIRAGRVFIFTVTAAMIAQLTQEPSLVLLAPVFAGVDKLLRDILLG